MTNSTTFVVSADAAVRDSVKELVEAADLQAEAFVSLQAFLDAVKPDCRGCLIVDAQTGDLNDPEQQAKLATAYAMMPGLMIADLGNVAIAVQALKAGVIDVVQKPYRDKNLLDSINKVLAVHADDQS